MSSYLVRCGNCEEEGLIRTIAEFLPNGLLKIDRQRQVFAEANGDYTLIAGTDFTLLCGRCKQIIFRKTPILIQQTTTLMFGTV